jgi:hypothetical protein
MFIFQEELSQLLLWCEFISAVIAIAYYNKIKHTYWKWFVFYLVYIFLLEKFGSSIFDLISIKKEIYFAYIGIPIEYLFFFWLYAKKSLRNNALFWTFSAIFLITFIPIKLFFNKLNVVYSLNITIGSFLLMILVLKEFYKQIRCDDILLFNENKMFYINLGVILFYIGTLPFFGLYSLLLNEPEIWNNYYIYFLVSNCIMYILFSLSFICGKAK